MMHALVPVTDEFEHDQGIAMARSLASSPDVSVDLITVVSDDDGDNRREDAWRYLEWQMSRFPASARVQGQVRSGEAVTELLRASLETDDAILILSPRWSANTMSFVHDSLSNQLMERTDVPVLLATTDKWPRSFTLENVMIPVTLTSPGAARILAVTGKLQHRQAVLRLVFVATGTGAEVDQLDATSDTGVASLEEQAGYQARWRLLELAEDLRQHGVRSTWELRYGDPVHELTRAAETTGANLIVFDWTAGDLIADQDRNEIVLRVSHNTATPALVLPPAARLSGDCNPAGVRSSALSLF